MTGQIIQPDAFKQHRSNTDDDEAGWITQLKAGKQTALKPLYDKYVKRVYALCFRLSGDAEIAEDICQEVFVQVWQKIGNFRGDSKFSTWLFSVTSHQAINHMRKQKRWWASWFVNNDSNVGNDESGSVDSVINSIPTTDEQHDFSYSGNGLDKHILKLPKQSRIVFVLFAIEGWRHEEIGKELDIAVGSSKAQYHRARQLLQKSLSDEEINCGVVA